MSKQSCGEYNDPAIQYQRTCGGSKKKGGAVDYPFSSEIHDYPIPNKVDFPISKDISTNFVSNNDLYGCKTGGSKKQIAGDCECANTTMQLGGSRQNGAGYGYTVNVEDAITNRPIISRYSTESSCQGGGSKKAVNEYLSYVGNQGQKLQKGQRGGSAASNSLMEYFLDFQHKCSGSEIY